MNRTRALFRSGLVRVERFDHPPGVHPEPAEERSERFSVNFVEAGNFTVATDGRRWRVGADAVFLTAPNRAYFYDHDEGIAADVCLRVVFEDDWRSGLVEVTPGSLEQCSPVLPLTNRRAYLRDRLLNHLQGPSSTLLLESLCGEALLGVSEQSSIAAGPYRTTQLSWYAQRIDRAREILDGDFAADHSLRTLAREAGMSVFHFARVFRELAGIPPHRYLIRRRLRVAFERLQQGASVTDACFDTGFANLSHFTRSFQRLYGVSPSGVRGDLRWRAAQALKRSSGCE